MQDLKQSRGQGFFHNNDQHSIHYPLFTASWNLKSSQWEHYKQYSLNSLCLFLFYKHSNILQYTVKFVIYSTGYDLLMKSSSGGSSYYDCKQVLCKT